MKKLLFLFLAVFPALALASDGKNYDILPRTVNFLIIVAIIFYFVKEPVKKAYNDRIKRISDSLDAASKRLEESKIAREQAMGDLEIAKSRAIALIETAKKEAVNLREKTKEATKFEIERLEKAYEEQKAFEERKIRKNVVTEILDGVFDEKSLEISQSNLIKIIQKKAS